MTETSTQSEIPCLIDDTIKPPRQVIYLLRFEQASTQRSISTHMGKKIQISQNNNNNVLELRTYCVEHLQGIYGDAV